MTTDKKNLPEIRIVTYDGDLSKKWHIEWKEGDQRFQKRDGINKHKTIEGRTQAAEKLKAFWLSKLSKSGKTKTGIVFDTQYKAIIKYFEQSRHGWRTKSIQTHQSRLNVFFEWNNRQVITADRIKEFIAYQLSIGKQQNTVSGYFRSFKNIFVPAIGAAVLEDIKVKKVPGTPAQYFSQAQVKFLAARMKESEPKLWLGVQLLYYCFIRPGESRLLRVGDVLIEDKKICIPKEVSKNKKMQYVIIPDPFVEVLAEEVLGRNPAEYLVGGTKPMSVNYLKYRHQAFLKKLHFDTVRHKLYSWKHTGAVMAVKAGVNIKQLQMQLRHHSLDQVNAYLRQLGIMDLEDFSSKIPGYRNGKAASSLTRRLLFYFSLYGVGRSIIPFLTHIWLITSLNHLLHILRWVHLYIS